MEMGPDKKGLSRAYILQAVEDSLRRLQTDHIDLYQSHKDDAETPLEETLGAFGELIRQGKVRAIGASNYSAERLAEALRVSQEQRPARATSASSRTTTSASGPGSRRTWSRVCREAGLGVIPYYSLASGFLTGKYRSEADLAKSARGQGVKKYLNDRGFRILAALDEVAARYASTPARVAIAWLLARPSVTAPIASATSVEQLDDLIEATRLKLDGPAVELLNAASASPPSS